MKKKLLTSFLSVIALSALIGTGIMAEDNTIKSKGKIEVGDDIVIDSEDITNLDTRINNINSFIGSSDISSIGDGTVTGAINTLNNNLAYSLDGNAYQFRIGVDDNGNVGYYKGGADTVTPFKSAIKIPSFVAHTSGANTATMIIDCQNYKVLKIDSVNIPYVSDDNANRLSESFTVSYNTTDNDTYTTLYKFTWQSKSAKDIDLSENPFALPSNVKNVSFSYSQYFRYWTTNNIVIE